MVPLSLTHCFLIDLSLRNDTIFMELPFEYFKGSHVEFSKLWCISIPEGCFYLSKQCRS